MNCTIVPVCVLSDDLTGAMDAGVQLVKKGYRVEVFFDTEKFRYEPEKDAIIIIDTETRNIPETEAYERIASVADTLKRQKLRICYKKTDSTLRGNLGSEMKALLDGDSTMMIAYAPALPYNGRITRNGNHYVNGRLLTETDIAKDPFSPIKSAFIPDVLSGQYSGKCCVIDFNTVKKGVRETAAELKRMYDSGCRIVVLDVLDDNDLAVIAEAIGISSLNILAAGSAGLFPHMFKDIEAKPETENDGAQTPCSMGQCFAKPVIVISGSPAEASKIQISRAENAGYPDVHVVKLDITSAASGGKASQTEYKRVISEFIENLSAGKSVILDGAGESKAKIFMERKNDAGILRKESENIQNLITRVVKESLQEFEVAGLMISGGDTAVSIFRELGSYGILITGEPEPYVAAGVLKGGLYRGIPVITKAGGFGCPDSFINGIKYLRGI